MNLSHVVNNKIRRLILFPMIRSTQENKKKYYQQATYEDEFLLFPQPSTGLFFQEIDHFDAIVTPRSTYNEPLKICPWRT